MVRAGLAARRDGRGRVDDLSRFAVAVAGFIRALQRCDTAGAPLAGEHSFYRATSPAFYDEQARRCLAALDGRVDRAGAAAVWEAALAAEWCGAPAWFHGDIAVGNGIPIQMMGFSRGPTHGHASICLCAPTLC
ncbi:hypothetical protein GCM10010399_86720 [Dactylosporangium fulvum]